jgi:hypothetical protein
MFGKGLHIETLISDLWEPPFWEYGRVSPSYTRCEEIGVT